MKAPKKVFLAPERGVFYVAYVMYVAYVIESINYMNHIASETASAPSLPAHGFFQTVFFFRHFKYFSVAYLFGFINFAGV